MRGMREGRLQLTEFALVPGIENGSGVAFGGG